MDRDETRLSLMELRLARLELRIDRLEEAAPEAARAPGMAPAAPPAGQSPRPVLRFEPPAPPVAAAHPVVPGALWAAPAATAAPAVTAPAPSATPERPVEAWAPIPPVIPGPGQASEPEPASPGISFSLKELEERFAGRALAWIGGLALVAAAIFFLSLAFSRGWITEPMRVLVGIVVGGSAFGAGAVLLERRNQLVGNVLTGVGVGIVEIALLAATRLYGLLPVELGLLGALVMAAVAVAAALRFNARSIAAYGLVAALLAPPVMGASPTLVTLLFVAVVLVATTTISLFRSWRWLPSLAFLLAAPQLASWIAGDADTTQALVALAGFWLINTAAAAGEEVRIRRDDLRPSSATLVLASGTFLLWGLFTVLDGDLATWRGTAIGLAALAHLLVAGWFLGRQGLAHLFGNLLGGAGVALVALAAFVQLGAPAVPMAWAAEAVALAWLAARRRHIWSAAAALGLGVLTVLHIVGVEYPLNQFALNPEPLVAQPFLHDAAASLGAVLAALAVAVLVVPIRWVRSAFVGTAVVLVTYALPFEMAGTGRIAALTVLALTALMVEHGLARLADAPHLADVSARANWLPSAALAAALPGLLVMLLVPGTEIPSSLHVSLAEPPFLNSGCASVAIALLGLTGAGLLVPARLLRSVFGAAGVLLLAWAIPAQVDGIARVALLAALLPLAAILDRLLGRFPTSEGLRAQQLDLDVPIATGTAVIGWAAALVLAVTGPLGASYLGERVLPQVPFTDLAALEGALLVGALLATVRWLEFLPGRRVAAMAAALVAVHVVALEVQADLDVVLWLGIAALAMAAARLDAAGSTWYRWLAAAIATLAVLAAFIVVAPGSRLWVSEQAWPVYQPLLPLWWLALAVIASLAGLGARRATSARAGALLNLAAVATAVYAVSVAVVDVFAGRTGSAATEELAKQAQVGLSVWWTAAGAGLLVTGLARAIPLARHAGFALLGLATAKVVLVDMASMDVAYRALVLFGLGLLLLASAYAVSRFRGPRAGHHGSKGGAAASA